MGLERGRERDCTRSCKSGVLARVVCVEGAEPSKDSSCLCPPSCHRNTGIADVNHCIRLTWVLGIPNLGSPDGMKSTLCFESSLQSHTSGFPLPGKLTI